MTPKQKQLLQSMRKYGDLYTGYTSSSMRTFESLVKRGLVEVVDKSEYGKTFHLVAAPQAQPQPDPQAEPPFLARRGGR
jgi:hypothetical protein